MKVWMVATYKINERKRLQENLQNQNFDYYHPKILVFRNHLVPKEEYLFPGYVFINANIDRYQKIKYTKGIINVLKFNNNIAVLNNSEIAQLKKIEKKSFVSPIKQKVFVGQKAKILDGPLKGLLISVASMPEKDRIDVFINILGSKRTTSVSLNEIKLY